MSQAELREHRKYLADSRKIDAYRAALAELVTSDDVVLDLGAGTGLLGYLACEAGASSVIAVDRGDILGVARQIAIDNGFADRITHVQASSTELELTTKASVAVSDQIGGVVYDAGTLLFYADARRRLLAPDARLIPASFRIFFVPVTFDEARETVEFWATRPADLDLTAARNMAVNTEWYYAVDADEDVVALAEAREAAAFAADHDDPIQGGVEFLVVQDGRFDGYLGFFEARLSPSVTLTNDPWSAERFDRWCNFYPADLKDPNVKAGQTVRLDVDLRPRLNLMSWCTSIDRGSAGSEKIRHSTFEGRFLTRQSLDRLVEDRPVSHSKQLDLVRIVIDLIDGSRSQADIVEALADHVGQTFVSTEHLRDFVRRVCNVGREPGS